MTCPQCKESKAHRSHRDGFKDWCLGLFNRTPYRCRGCRARFYVYLHGETSSNLRTPEERKILKIRRRYKWRQSKRTLLAFGICFVLLVCILYLLMQQRVPSG